MLDVVVVFVAVVDSSLNMSIRFPVCVLLVSVASSSSSSWFSLSLSKYFFMSGSFERSIVARIDSN